MFVRLSSDPPDLFLSTPPLKLSRRGALERTRRFAFGSAGLADAEPRRMPRGGLCGEIPPTAWPQRLDTSNPAWAAYVAAVYGESQPLPTPASIEFLYHAEGIPNAVTQFSLPDPYCYHLTMRGPAPCGSPDMHSTPRVNVRGGDGREWIARTHMLYNPIHALNGERTLNYTDDREFPDGSWVEVLSYNAACGKQGGCKKRDGCNFVIARGSGVFVPIGRALRIPRKRDASIALQIENPTPMVKNGYDSRAWCKHATKLGFDSVITRFRLHAGAPVGLPMTMDELVLCTSDCRSWDGCGACPPTPLRTGLSAGRPCDCDPGLAVVNCARTHKCAVGDKCREHLRVSSMPSAGNDACSRNATRRRDIEQAKTGARLADNSDVDFMDCTYLSRQRAFDGGLNGTWAAVSGLGSSIETQGPLLAFLPRWLAKNGIRSMVEASSGHWASGWQRYVRWPRIDYVGADVLQSIVDANSRLLQGNANFGLASAHFERVNMVTTALPKADLLLSKDTIIHFSNARIQSLLRLSVTVCPPRFKYVLFIHEPLKGENVDIEDVDQHHALNLRAAPVWLNTTTVFEYGAGRYLKTVELFDVAEHCARVGPGTRRSLMPLHVTATCRGIKDRLVREACYVRDLRLVAARHSVHLTVSRPQVVSLSPSL